jgi:hypothetical protein
MSGADRDWVNLASSLASEDIRFTWAGVYGTEYLRPYVKATRIDSLVDLDFPIFTYLIHHQAELRRSPWLWTKILTDHALQLRRPYTALRKLGRADPFDLVISNTVAVTLGAVYARRWRLPHLWCVKEVLDASSFEVSVR